MGSRFNISKRSTESELSAASFLSIQLSVQYSTRGLIINFLLREITERFPACFPTVSHNWQVPRCESKIRSDSVKVLLYWLEVKWIFGVFPYEGSAYRIKRVIISLTIRLSVEQIDSQLDDTYSANQIEDEKAIFHHWHSTTQTHR